MSRNGKVVVDLDEPRPPREVPGFVAFIETSDGSLSLIAYVASCQLGLCRWRYALDPVVKGDISGPVAAAQVLRRHWQQFHPFQKEDWGPYV